MGNSPTVAATAPGSGGSGGRARLNASAANIRPHDSYAAHIRELILTSSVTHSLLLILPIACALLLRVARLPGPAVVGGIVAGILLGPGVLGRTAPEAYERLFVGGAEERLALEAAITRHEAQELAWRSAGTEPGADIRDANLIERANLQREWETAQWNFQRPQRSYGSALIVLALFGAGLLRTPTTERPWAAATSIGLWAALIPGGLAATYLVLTDRPIGGALLGTAAVAIGPWVLTPADHDAADDAELGGAILVETAARVASVLAILVALAGAIRTRGVSDGLWALPLLALPVGWLLPALPAASTAGRRVRMVLKYGVVPVLAACAAQRVEFVSGFAIITAIIFLLVSADARWIGAMLGAMLPGGRRGLRTARLVIGSMASAPTQLSVIVVAAGLWALDDGALTGLLLGAALLDVAAPLRRSLADQLAGAEDVIENDDEL